MWPARLKKNYFYLQVFDTLIKIILEGRGFLGGSDDKMRKMWLGQEIVVVGLPLLISKLFHLQHFIDSII